MKYILELSEKQARLVSWALDTLPRLIEGQGRAYQDLFEQAWEKRSKKATGNFMDKEFEGGWYAMREDAEQFCRDIKRRFWALSPNADYGIHYDETADILWDIYQCLRHELWKNDQTKLNYTVDAYPASQFGTEPLCKVTSKDDDNN